jgi:pimeloyl-ACP methyl ester carboxylesterase
MKAELVSIPTPDEPLAGLLYLPDAVPRGAVLLCHGNQGNFYTGPPAFLPPALLELGLACLAFNRRGHDILATGRSREPVGGAFQTTAEAIEDGEIAACFLGDRGLETPVLIGHSNGGLLAAEYVARHPETPALVLLSAHRGGDVARRISAAGLFAQDRLDQLVTRAQALASGGKGHQLLLLPAWWYVISARSLLDYDAGMPELLELAPRIRCPVLYLKGRSEDPELYPARPFAERCRACRVVELDGCDHWYNGRDAEVASLVRDWLVEVLEIR